MKAYKNWKQMLEEEDFDCSDCAQEISTCNGCQGPEDLYRILKNQDTPTYIADPAEKQDCVGECNILRKVAVCCGENPETHNQRELIIFDEGLITIIKACSNLSAEGLCGIYGHRPKKCAEYPSCSD